MKLLNVTRQDGNLLIHTDKGIKKKTLKWGDNDALEAKCRSLIGKEIGYTTLAGWEHDVWFKDVYEDVMATTATLQEQDINFPVDRKFSSHKVTKIFGPPGTGKTKTLMDIVKDHLATGVSPEDIAFVSFTNAAADEAKARVAEEFPDMGSISFPNFSTLHSLATRIGGALNKVLCQAEHVKNFDASIACEDEWIRQGDATSSVVRFKHPVMDQYCLALARCQDYEPHQTEKAVAALAQYFDKSTKEIEGRLDEYAKNYIKAYEGYKASNNLADFNDVIANVTKSDFEEKLPTFELLIVDEAQDLSDMQWHMVKKLMDRAKEVYIAGDDDQAIMVSFGASARAFLDLKGEESELGKSYRVPKEVSDYVNLGVMPALKGLPNRRDKNWLPAEHSGSIFSVSNRTYESKDGALIHCDFDADDLLTEISKRASEEWLILTPTRRTGENISKGLSNLGIPHFYRNRPQVGATRDTKINVRTIHTAKGLGADNVAVIADSMGDIAMLGGNPRLAYVALTRAKKMLYPRVLREGLLPKMLDMKEGRHELSMLAKKYMAMFPAIKPK